MPKKAQSKNLAQAWLILSNEAERFDQAICLVDLFLPETKMHIPQGDVMGEEEKKGKLAEMLWLTLMDRGFRLNHEIEYQYSRQQTCIWCGGQVLWHGGEDSYEVRCSNCNYLYDED